MYNSKKASLVYKDFYLTSMIYFLFQNYPYNFKKFAKDNNVTYRDFFHSLKDTSFWYKNLIFDLIPMENKKGREIVESDVLGTIQYLKSINEQIHYTGQYLANKSIYFDYRKSRNKEKFYDDHRAELTLYESALRILREKSQGQKLPTLKMLREEKNRLTKLQTVQRDEFNTRREYERELRTVCSNVNIILRHPHIQETLHETSQGHSYFR